MGQIAIIGGGPAGLIAAETLAERGHDITVFDQMPTPGRKFQLAGRGGLNLTHSEARDRFLLRYGSGAAWLAPCIDAFPPDALRRWCAGLGQDVFVGSSGRVFPQTFKAAPLLRAWLRRLDGMGVRFVAGHRWVGFSPRLSLRFETADGEVQHHSVATLLALGGGSWPRMGSDGGWVHVLRQQNIGVADLRASNCGVLIPWSPVFLLRFEGQPLKRIAVMFGDARVRGEALITREGLEGGAIYAILARLRGALELGLKDLRLFVDLLPDMSSESLSVKLDGPRHGRSLGNFLRQAASLSPAAIGLVREAILAGSADVKLSRVVKALPLTVTGLQPIGRAISSAGGVLRDSVDDRLMLKELPGVFVAGEMLDWDAPTGGYLLQACFSTGVFAANGISAWLGKSNG
jgi:uncharacterized flavoprotein (TIGR03862 family)